MSREIVCNMTLKIFTYMLLFRIDFARIFQKNPKIRKITIAFNTVFTDVFCEILQFLLLRYIYFLLVL